MALQFLASKDLRALPQAELASELKTLRQALWERKVKATGGTLQKPHEISSLRRQIARVLTIQGEVKLS